MLYYYRWFAVAVARYVYSGRTNQTPNPAERFFFSKSKKRRRKKPSPCPPFPSPPLPPGPKRESGQVR